MGPLLAFHEESELLVRLAVRKELVAGLLGEGLEVLHRAGVGGDDLEHLPGAHVGERLLGAQDGKGAVEAPGVEFFVEVHDESSSGIVIRSAPGALPPGWRAPAPAGSCTRPSHNTPGRGRAAPPRAAARCSRRPRRRRSCAAPRAPGPRCAPGARPWPSSLRDRALWGRSRASPLYTTAYKGAFMPLATPPSIRNRHPYIE